MDKTVTFDLTAAQIAQILTSQQKGPLGALARRLMAKPMERMAARHSGPTTVEFSAAAIRITTTESDELIDWSTVRLVNERAHAWVLALAPTGVRMIPASAVPAADRAQLSAQLRAWVGPKYKVREGGMRQAQ